MSVIKKTQCGMCAVSCGLEMEVENNQIVSVRPDPDSPRSQNYCCRKGRAAKYHTSHTQRLTQPLKRIGDEFVPISWEQANREIAQKANAIINKHGPRSFTILGGGLAACHSPAVPLIGIMNGVGSQYHFNPIGIEYMGSWWSNGRIYGDQARFQEPDEHNTDNLVLWGCNPYVTHQMSSARRVIRELSNDPAKRVIVIDPRVTETARMADMHIALRTGTDALFLRALIALILKNNWQDQAYIDKWCKGFDKAAAWFQDFDIDAALQVCRVPFAQVEAFAKILCTENWGVHQDLGVFCGRHNTLTSYLIVSLCAITGSLFKAKNNIISDLFLEFKKSDELDSRTWRTRDNSFPVTGVFPTGSFAPEVLTEGKDRIRVAFASMTNPARSFPNSERVEEALEKLDLFVIDDITMTESTRHAHYVLPAKSTYENHDFNTFQVNYPHVVCQLRQPVLEAKGDCKAPAEIWLDIADAMGLIPDLPHSLYDKAREAARQNDRIPYALELLKFLTLHPKHKDVAQLIIGKTLGRAMGNVTAAMLFAGLLVSPLAANGKMKNAGIEPSDKHPLLSKLPMFKDVARIDAAFQMVLDRPEGAIIATADNSNEDFHIRDCIAHKDKKLHLWCSEIDGYIQRITPEQEQAELDEYPMVVSSGRHTDFGSNTIMRNPDTYRHRKDAFSALINPFDARDLKVKAGEMIRLTSEAGEITLPVDISYGTTRGYVMVPHHFGLQFNDRTYGAGANKLSKEEARDELTGNPLLRHIRCRVERADLPTAEQEASNA